MHYVYVLKSLKDGGLYTGYTHHLDRRIEEHNLGISEATKYRTPLKLVYYEACINRTDAIHRERYLKTTWGKRFIKNRIKNYLLEDSAQNT